MYLFELQGLLTFGLPIWIIIRIITLINKRKEGIKLNIINEIFTNLFVLYLIFLNRNNNLTCIYRWDITTYTRIEFSRKK